MELKTIFQMTKADRYTQDGRDEIAKLQETEDVTYKTGDISQKTGLQKQPDGSWAPPKGGAKKSAAGKKDAAKPTTEELNTLKDIMREYRKNPNKQTEQIMNEAKSHLMKNRGMTPEQLGKLGREVMAETNKPTDKYKDLPGAQKKDALFASTFEGISIGQTQNQMERQGWELISTGEETGENVNVYGKPDGSKVTMKHDGNKITSTEYEAPAENPDYPFKPKTSEERAERAKFEKDRDDFIERMNAYREESKQWTNRAKGERTATLVDWLDDWDKHPEEKNDAAYAAIEKELASRGVNRAGRQDAKKADNAGRNEFYRRAYEGDAAPRQLTGDCKIRIRK